MPVYPLTINLSASDLSAALVKSVHNLDPIRAPQFVVGRDRQFFISFVDNSGASDISGSEDYNLAVSIGTPGALPTGGTWSIETATDTIENIPFDASLLYVTDLLANQNARVTGVPGSYYEIEYLDGNPVDLPTLTENLLSPASSVAIKRIRAAGGGLNEIHLIRLKQTPPVLQLDWTPGNGGWTGILSANSVESLRVIQAANPFSGTLEISLIPETGEWQPLLSVPVKVFADVSDDASFVPPGFTLENFRGKPNRVVSTLIAAGETVTIRNNEALVLPILTIEDGGELIIETGGILDLR
jgi:hypothetical protein